MRCGQLPPRSAHHRWPRTSTCSLHRKVMDGFEGLVCQAMGECQLLPRTSPRASPSVSPEPGPRLPGWGRCSCPVRSLPPAPSLPPRGWAAALCPCRASCPQSVASGLGLKLRTPAAASRSPWGVRPHPLQGSGCRLLACRGHCGLSCSREHPLPASRLVAAGGTSAGVAP